jgi:hypothetical protein
MVAFGQTTYTDSTMDGTTGNAELDTDVTGATQDMWGITDVSAHLVWTGTGSPAGTVKLQGSNDNSNWEDITDMSASVSGAGSDLMEIINPAFRYLRAFYDRSSGGTGAAITCTWNKRRY